MTAAAASETGAALCLAAGNGKPGRYRDPDFSEKFAEEVSGLSDGSMKIQVYANSSLGGDRDLLETCADGDIPFVVQNTAPQVSFMHDLAVFDLPCVFDSLDDCREKIDDPQF